MNGKACAGRVALVTGASKGGCGTAIALRLAAEGARVAITARSLDGLDRTRSAIEAQGGEVFALACDLADPQQRESLVAAVETRLGGIDILVNNAAAGGYKPFKEWTLVELEAMQQVNVWAPWRLAQQALPDQTRPQVRVAAGPHHRAANSDRSTRKADHRQDRRCPHRLTSSPSAARHTSAPRRSRPAPAPAGLAARAPLMAPRVAQQDPAGRSGYAQPRQSLTPWRPAP